jgi:biotin transport system substrate-specific component
MKLRSKELSTVALFAAVMAICSQVSIPIPISPAPITLSLFGVFLTSMLLDYKSSTLVQIVYVLLGICGAPVFQGFSGGISRALGPTGGYIISYIPMSYVMGWLTVRFNIVNRLKMIYVMTCGLAICYVFGTAWLMLSTQMSISKALYAAVLPFIPLDIVKIFAASTLSHAIKKARHSQG